MTQKFRYVRYTILMGGMMGVINQKFILDKTITNIRALQVTADRPDLLFYRATQRIEINGEEIYPEDYDCKLLMSGINVPPDDRFIQLGQGRGIPAGNGEVKVLLKDYNNNPALVFAPYTFALILACELKS